MGRCYTVYSKRRLSAKEASHDLSFKYRGDIKVYVHQQGEEFWLLSTNNFPTEVGTFTLQIENDSEITGAEIKITRKDTYLLNQENTPCTEHQESKTNVMYKKFIECGRKHIRSKLEANISCTVEGLGTLNYSHTKLGVCQDDKSAADTFSALDDQLNQFSISPSEYGCPMPCRHTTYKLKVIYLHMNAWFDRYNLSRYPRGTFSINYYYETLDVEETMENLVMDLGGLLAEAGGNIGLLLGFSLISLVFSFIECCEYLNSYLLRIE